MSYLMAFVVGGLLCVLAQLAVDLTHYTQAHVMVGFVSLGAILSGLGLYQSLVDTGGAGATVPLTGFGHALVQGILEAVPEQGLWMALFTGGFTSTALGVTAAVLFGFLVSAVFQPKG